MSDYVETDELSLEPMELEREEVRVFGDFSSLDEGPGNATVVAEEKPSVQEQSSTRQPDSVFGERPSAFKRKARANGYALEPLAGEKQQPGRVTNFYANDRSGASRRQRRDRRHTIRLNENRRASHGRRGVTDC